MNNIETSIPELKTVEPTLKKESKVVMLVNSSSSKKSSKNKKKRKSTKPKGGVAKKKAKEASLKGTCFHYRKKIHRKRNYKAYLESKKKVTCDALSSSSIYVIEVNTISQSNQCVLDIGCDSHICIDMQGLHNSRKPTKGEFNLRVGNGVRVVAIAMGTYILYLPSGLCLNLDDCFYVPSLTQNIIYVSCLNKKGFHLNFSNNSCSIMLNDYWGGTLSNGFYILDMSNPFFKYH